MPCYLILFIVLLQVLFFGICYGRFLEYIVKWNVYDLEKLITQLKHSDKVSITVQLESAIWEEGGRKEERGESERLRTRKKKMHIKFLLI